MVNELKLVPRSADGILRVIIPGRISTPQQDEASIEASHIDNEAWLRRVYSGQVEIINVGEQASGWLVDRPSMDLARSMIARHKIDLVLMGEIRELFRNPRLQWAFVQDCVDYDTRMIAHADTVDTATENWELNMHVAIIRHGMTVPEARMRVRRKATFSFGRGGMVLKVKFGYAKLSKEQAKTGDLGPVGLRIVKITEHTVWILEMRRRVLEGQTDVMVAKWLNDNGVETGPYANSKKWTGRLVRDLLIDPILSGRRQFRKSLSRLIYRTGKHKAEHNPSPLEAEECPELAHMTPAEQDELIQYFADWKARNKNSQKSGHESPLWDVPRANSLWPGQTIRCSACRSLYYQCGEELKCKRALPDATEPCWNHVILKVETVKDRVLPVLWAALLKNPQATKALLDVAWKYYCQSSKGTSIRLANVQMSLKEIEKKINNMLKLQSHNPDLESVANALASLENQQKSLLIEEREIQARAGQTKQYATIQDLERDLINVFEQMASDSREFSILLRKLIIAAKVIPVQALDCPQVRPRLVFTISFASFDQSNESAYEEHHTLDLFEPPVHVKFLAACVAAKKANPRASLKQIASELKINYMTVKRALDYWRRMQAQGLTEPYRMLTEKPAIASRWGRRQDKNEIHTEEDQVRKAS